MKKNLWVFDIDNTLAKRNEEIQQRVDNFSEQLYPFPLPSDFIEDNPEILLGASPFVGSAEALRRLVGAGSKVVYVNARSPWFRNLTEHWIPLNGFPDGIVICTKNKRAVVPKMKPSPTLQPQLEAGRWKL